MNDLLKRKNESKMNELVLKEWKKKKQQQRIH